MGVHEPKQDEARTSTNLTSGSTSSGGGAELFIITPSVPYAEDAGATATRITPVEEVVTVKSDFEVLARTMSDTAALVTLVSANDVLASGPSTLVI
ncbi:hypothetical protein Tco_0068686 [Tanacetum coccineum]